MVDFKPFSLKDAAGGGGNQLQTLMALAQLQRSGANARAAGARHRETMGLNERKFAQTKEKQMMTGAVNRANYLKGLLETVHNQEDWEAKLPWAQQTMAAMSSDKNSAALPQNLTVL